MDKILVYFAIKYEGEWDSIYAAINKKERVDPVEMEKVLSKNTSKYVTLIDDKYPARLKSIYKPPFVLFYKGDFELLNGSERYIAVIGSRKNNDYGKNVTSKLVSELVKENVIIVSGLASGIDSIAHKCSLDNGGKTIAVVGSGLDRVYPLENEGLQNDIYSNGLVVSEYPSFIESKKDNFPKRNRIIAGLSDGVLVTQAKKKSGSMITVSRALEMGKEIFCVPDIIGVDSGCNQLIKEGARLVENAYDVLSEL